MSNRRVILSLVLALTACAPEHPFGSDAQPTETSTVEDVAPSEAGEDSAPDALEVDVAEDGATADGGSDAVAPDVDGADATDAAAPSDDHAAPDAEAVIDAAPEAAADAQAEASMEDRTVRDSGVDTGVPPRDTGVGCVQHSDCADGIEATMDLCFSGRCENRSCDDGNPCTRDVGSSVGCTNTVLPDGTMCRPAGGSNTYTCSAGVCPSCGGEGQACCDWPGSTQVCQAAARCRVVSGGFRRCVTCGGAGQRCCELADGISMASQRCSSGLSCSSIPGVPGTCR